MRHPPCPLASHAALGLALLLAGCSGMNREGEWPTLAPRPGEISPLVPRTPLGACAGCGQDVVAAPAVVTAPDLPQAPADVAARLAATDSAIARVEKDLPARRQATDKAIAAAAGSGADSNLATEAEVERSRLEALFLPLDVAARGLDDVEDDLAGTKSPEAALARIAGLRARLVVLEGQR